jgi:hypothetical protein
MTIVELVGATYAALAAGNRDALAQLLHTRTSRPPSPTASRRASAACIAEPTR